MRKQLLCTALIAATAALSGCGINDYTPPEGVTIVTTPTTTRPVISGFPTTVRSTTTNTSSTTTVAPPPPAPVVTTVIVVPLPPPVVTTTVVAPPPPPPAPVRPASQTLATGSTIGRCGGTRLVMNMPINNVPVTLTSSGLHFDTAPSIPIVSAIVQTTNAATDEFTGYVLPLSQSMVGTGNKQSLDFSISAPEAVKAVVLCDSFPQ